MRYYVTVPNTVFKECIDFCTAQKISPKHVDVYNHDIVFEFDTEPFFTVFLEYAVLHKYALAYEIKKV